MIGEDTMTRGSRITIVASIVALMLPVAGLMVAPGAAHLLAGRLAEYGGIVPQNETHPWQQDKTYHRRTQNETLAGSQRLAGS